MHPKVKQIVGPILALIVNLAALILTLYAITASFGNVIVKSIEVLAKG